MFSVQRVRFAGLAAIAATLIACGGEKKEATPAAGAPAATGAAAASVTPTGKVIEISMNSDEKGNYYSPNKIEAHRGDVLRFVVKTGVHNVHFLPDSNPGKTNLPPVTDFLQIPGQTFDLLVALDPGHYYFQCDPHAALGMKGTLEVEEH